MMAAAVVADGNDTVDGKQTKKTVKDNSLNATSTATSSWDPLLEAKISETIALYPVVVISKSTCPFCTKAKALLKEHDARFPVVELDELKPEIMNQVQDFMLHLTGARTVPRVFIGGVCVGGASDVAKLVEEGNLGGMLKNATDAYTKATSGVGSFPLERSQDAWRESLGDEQFRILRERRTEPPGSHPYNEFLPEKGYFACAGCDIPLYSAASKYASSCGWPVFSQCYESEDLGQHVMHRPDGSGSLEIVCNRCGGHLGHVFYDDVSATNLNGERH